MLQIIQSGKKINIEDVKALLAAINDLIELKLLIRKIAPSYNFNENTEKAFLSSINSLYQNLQPIFSKYIKNEQFPKLGISKDDKKIALLKTIKKNDVVLISANSSKKSCLSHPLIAIFMIYYTLLICKKTTKYWCCS